jgi:exodeoxyribonuclease VIII
MRDLMIDLETMGTSPTAAIVALGAVFFDTETGQLGDTFYHAISLESSVAAGGVVDMSTVLWWLKQSDAARAELTDELRRVSLREALHAFHSFINREFSGDVRVWGNGSDFDNVILASAYKSLGLEAPWKFYNNRCYRTLKAFLPLVDVAREGTHHNALHNAVHQARVLCEGDQALSHGASPQTDEN